MTKTSTVDQEGDIDVGTSYNVPPANERYVTRHIPSGSSSLAEINLVGGLGVCNALQAPPSDKSSTVHPTGQNQQ